LSAVCGKSASCLPMLASEFRSDIAASVSCSYECSLMLTFIDPSKLICPSLLQVPFAITSSTTRTPLHRNVSQAEKGISTLIPSLLFPLGLPSSPPTLPSRQVPQVLYTTAHLERSWRKISTYLLTASVSFRSSLNGKAPLINGDLTTLRRRGEGTT
jgi:hypothetical protein